MTRITGFSETVNFMRVNSLKEDVYFQVADGIFTILCFVLLFVYFLLVNNRHS